MAKDEELEELRVHEELEKERRRDMMKKRNEEEKQSYNQLRVSRTDTRNDKGDVALGQLRDFIKSQRLSQRRRR